ncbi:phage head morphogenesis protein [Pararhizobium sp.]|uniref:phage head morphogenesis protein n=1 Tax=Pararhizobium sp. TaxID=1977563 RepID=UPI002717496F|nr:minor capsid protein [Pararhizobium sp.]MDO9417023.1 minor capsid protein [Pararhizobium sp.]
MLRYSAAKLAKRPKSTTAFIETPPARLAADMDYIVALRAMLKAFAAETRDGIIPLYAQERAQKRQQSGLTVDVDRMSFARLHALSSALQRIATDTVNRILNLEAKRHTDNFAATVKKAIGIDVRALVREEDLGEYLEAAIARNVSLIKSLADDVVRRVEQTVIENSLAGNSVKTLRKALVEQYGITDRRAQTIARDQMGKFHADMDQIRQQQAGIDEYEWRTVADERVRERHRQLNGTVYKWGQSTGAEQGLPPGKPVLCRCRARGVIVF